MPDYKESGVSGVKWQRANLVKLHNPITGTHAAEFMEESAVELSDGDIVTKPIPGSLVENLTTENVLEDFDIIDPASGDVLGKMSYGMYQVVSYSLYIHVAAKRDAAPPVVVDPGTTPQVPVAPPPE